MLSRHADDSHLPRQWCLDTWVSVDLLPRYPFLNLAVACSVAASILWVGTGLFGFSMASVFPSGIHLIENFIDVTGRVSTILVVASSLGDVAVPLLLGWLIGVWPALFIVLSFIILVLAILIFAVLYKYASSRSAQYVLLDEAADVLTMTALEASKEPVAEERSPTTVETHEF
eukprot:m.65115 g.65115  ORF g.65115 m.65115 type:complete len:173 (+) comp49769_c0_seq2:1098-1616(+)